MKVLDLSSVTWKAATGTFKVSEMETDHLIRTFAWVDARLNRLNEIEGEIHPVIVPQVYDHNGKTLAEWREILLAAINLRGEAHQRFASQVDCRQ